MARVRKRTWKQTSHSTPPEKMAVWAYPRPKPGGKKRKPSLRDHKVGKP